MQRRQPESSDRLAMLGRRVPDVLGELEARVVGVGTPHVAVARLLGQHRCGCDRRAAGIAADDRSLVVPEPPDRETIAQADAAVTGDAPQGIS